MRPLDNYQLLAVGQQLAVGQLIVELQLEQFAEERLEELRQLLGVRLRRRLVLWQPASCSVVNSLMS
jgi:hypothetical protein